MNLKIRIRKSVNLKEIHFIDFNLQTQSITNTNPLTQELKLLPGKYLFGLIIRDHLILPKSFSFKMSSLNSNSFVQKIE